MKKNRLPFILVLFTFLLGCGMESIEGLKNNYETNASQIIGLKDYFIELVPENYIVRIQYNSANNVDLFVYTTNSRVEIFGQWNVDLDNFKELFTTESGEKTAMSSNSLEMVKQRLNWNRETFRELYKKIVDANCIGICYKKPVEIEYGFMGMGLLSYLVFDEKLTIEQQEEYSDDCMHLFYKQNIVLQYGSGATGSLCNSELNRKK